MAVIELARPLTAVPIPSLRRERVVLAPGRLFAAGELVTVIATVGSGVAVCLWDYEAQVGGVAHYLIPTADGWEHAIRCGAGAIPALIERIVALGGRRERLTAKVFGGARAIADCECAHGAENVRTAVEILRNEQIRIVAADLEGDRARRLMFHVDDGRAWVKRL